MDKKKERVTRSQYGRKVGKKGKKSVRGVPESYDELKKARTFSLTDTAHQGIKELSDEQRTSMSEFLEQIGRKELIVSRDEDVADK